jgi:hypothetical protein
MTFNESFEVTVVGGVGIPLDARDELLAEVRVGCGPEESGEVGSNLFVGEIGFEEVSTDLREGVVVVEGEVPDVKSAASAGERGPFVASASAREIAERDAVGRIPSAVTPEVLERGPGLLRAQGERGVRVVLDLSGDGLSGAPEIDVLSGLEKEGLVVSERDPGKDSVPGLVDETARSGRCLAIRVADGRVEGREAHST